MKPVAPSLPVCLRSCRLLLLRSPDAVVAAPADGRAGLRWNALLLCGGEDGELLYRFAGTVDCSLFFVEASRDEGGPLDMQKVLFLFRYHRCCFYYCLALLCRLKVRMFHSEFKL